MKGKAQATTRQQGAIPNYIANDLSTLALITRIAIRDNRQCRGIWSRFGQPYVLHGVPDFTLSQRVRPNVRETQNDDGTTKSSDSHKGKSSLPSAKPESKLHPLVSMPDEIFPVRNHMDAGRFRFPRDEIIESEIRCRKGKNGKFLSSTTNAADLIFAPVDLSKMTIPRQKTIEKTPKQSVKHTEYRLYQDQLNAVDDQDVASIPSETYNQPSRTSVQPLPSSEQHPVPVSKRPSKLKAAEEYPILRWRGDFSKVRQKLNEELQDILVRQSMDRAMVMHDRSLLSKITESVQRRAADRLPHRTSVWSEVAHQRKAQQEVGLHDLDQFTLDNQKRGELYWELQVFVQKICTEDGIDPVKDQDLMATVEAIRGSLEDRTPLDLSFVLAVESKLKPRESPRKSKLMRFLCKYLKVSLEDIQELGEKESLPSSKHSQIVVSYSKNE